MVSADVPSVRDVLSDPIINAPDEEARKAERKASDAALAIRDLVDVMSTAGGRRFVNRLLAVSGVVDSTFNPTNPHDTAYREGRRAFGTELWRSIDSHCPELYIRMMREARRMPTDG